MDIVQIINDLEQEFVRSKNFLWSKKTLINMEKCASLIAELKANLPSSIQEASYVLSKKDQILNNASASAKKTIAEAEYRAGQLVSSSEIYKKSEIEARKLIADANRKCDELFEVTKQNIDNLLRTAEGYLSQNISVLKRNREELGQAISGLKNGESVGSQDGRLN